MSKNLNGVITSWNKGAERLFGYTAQKAIGQHTTLIIPPNRLNEEDEILSRIRRGQRVDHFETVRVRKDGTTIELSLTISPVRDQDGRVIGASKVARDIGERKRAERAMRASEERERKLTADALAVTAKFHAIFEQRHPMLDENGLAPALSWYVQGLAQRSGLCHCWMGADSHRRRQ